MTTPSLKRRRASSSLGKSACNPRSLLSHACAMAAGMLLVLQLHLFPPPETATGAVSVVKPRLVNKFDLLPIVILEKPPKPTSFQKLLIDSRPRVLLGSNSTVTVGPLYAFYPSKQELAMSKWLQEQASSTVFRDSSLVIFESIANVENRRQVLLSKTLWSRLDTLGHKVLVIDQESVMCSHPTTPLLAHLKYDWIGAAWKWAMEPDHPLHLGGNGAFSIRSPKHLLAILEKETPPPKGNEDMVWVRWLNEWAKSGETRRNVAPPTLPPHAVQQKFAVEEIASPEDVVPVAVYHLMRTMDYKKRESILRRCPEAKHFFPALHEPTCALVQCPKNMSLHMHQWNKALEENRVDECHDMCHVLYHPVAEAVSKWIDTTTEN